MKEDCQICEIYKQDKVGKFDSCDPCKIIKLKASLMCIITLGYKGNWQTASMVNKARQVLEETK